MKCDVFRLSHRLTELAFCAISYPDERFDEDLNLFAQCSVSSAFRAVLMTELLPV